MPSQLDELLARIRALQEDVEEEYRQRRSVWEERRIQLAGELARQQRRYKIGLFRFLRRSSLPVVLSAPVIYVGWVPFLLMDLFVTVYQAVCFPIYRIPKVRRADYLVFDREDLPYLNAIEKFNCFYCSYGNGVAAYAREVAARTEQYWCPIKHARRIRDAHARYPKFFDHGDAQAFREGLARLRRQYQDVDDEPLVAGMPQQTPLPPLPSLPPLPPLPPLPTLPPAAAPVSEWPALPPQSAFPPLPPLPPAPPPRVHALAAPSAQTSLQPAPQPTLHPSARPAAVPAPAAEREREAA